MLILLWAIFGSAKAEVCERKVGFICKGNDVVSGRTVDSEWACAQLCDQLSSCRAWTYKSSQRWCNAKTTSSCTGYDKEWIWLPKSCSSSHDGEVILGRKLLTTLPSIGPSYKISFDLFVNSYSGVNLQHGDWAEVLRFTCTKKDCCAPGDRIPIVLTNRVGRIAVSTQVGDNGNYHGTEPFLKTRTWTKLEIQQYQQNGKYYVEVKMAGSSVWKKENPKSREYRNVQVWASAVPNDPKWPTLPPANAKIRNLKVNYGLIQGPCPPGWIGFNGGKCFKYYSSRKTWQEALRSCQQCSSNPTSTLASIPDSATNDFLLTSVAPANSPGLWVGGSQNSAGTWGWSDGTRWSYQKWYPGEPNNHGGIEDYIELMESSERVSF